MASEVTAGPEGFRKNASEEIRVERRPYQGRARRLEEATEHDGV